MLHALMVQYSVDLALDSSAFGSHCPSTLPQTCKKRVKCVVCFLSILCTCNHSVMQYLVVDSP